MKKIMTEEEIIAAGGIDGIKYQGKEFPRYALLPDGSLYYKSLKNRYYKQKLTYRSNSFVYKLNYFIEGIKNPRVGETIVGGATLMLENFKHIDPSFVVIEYIDGNSSNIALSNLKYSLSQTLIDGIVDINLTKNFNYKFSYNRFTVFEGLSVRAASDIRCRTRLINKILDHFDLEELKLAIMIFNNDQFFDFIGMKKLKAVNFILRYYLNIPSLIIDYSCLLDIEPKEFADICKIVRNNNIHNIIEVKQAIEQIKPDLPDLVVIKVLMILYQNLICLDFNKIINILESYTNDNLYHTIYQLKEIGVNANIICYIFKINRYSLYGKEYKEAYARFKKEK